MYENSGYSQNVYLETLCEDWNSIEAQVRSDLATSERLVTVEGYCTEVREHWSIGDSVIVMDVGRLYIGLNPCKMVIRITF